MTRLTATLSLVLGFSAVGCVWSMNANWAPTVRTRASFDLQCPEQQVQVTDLQGAYSYGAQGCGKRAAYLIRSGAAVLNSEVMDVSAGTPRRSAPTERTEPKDTSSPD